MTFTPTETHLLIHLIACTQIEEESEAENCRRILGGGRDGAETLRFFATLPVKALRESSVMLFPPSSSGSVSPAAAEGEEEGEERESLQEDLVEARAAAEEAQKREGEMRKRLLPPPRVASSTTSPPRSLRRSPPLPPPLPPWRRLLPRPHGQPMRDVELRRVDASLGRRVRDRSAEKHLISFRAKKFGQKRHKKEYDASAGPRHWEGGEKSGKEVCGRKGGEESGKEVCGRKEGEERGKEVCGGRGKTRAERRCGRKGGEEIGKQRQKTEGGHGDGGKRNASRGAIGRANAIEPRGDRSLGALSKLRSRQNPASATTLLLAEFKCGSPSQRGGPGGRREGLDRLPTLPP
uniref:Uncharacterized protein n=1 Tax=Chromera velia CCMP2878 TaxID=1169474 RepID=A0A0G4HKP5_9ALVE|eukprot:Cvel_28586.t1-p1 / transcript=Cvel_28586.t1 / gene=Cvel_28586 / organism=Chromera_velia_CCMP2878 / gene_product=hypothetical protein / transcript_product=hypothetical protein / location=Cvel_scaffold3769:1598-7829(-) / protein_length=349 / sequence_SO=supercontig / SO=protein_coding / is_pseudo=false